jgi:hypothetical protein
MLPGKPLGWPAAARRRLASAGLWVGVELGAVAELDDGQCPVVQRRGQGAVDGADALEDRVDLSLAVHGEAGGLALAHVGRRPALQLQVLLHRRPQRIILDACKT